MKKKTIWEEFNEVYVQLNNGAFVRRAELMPEANKLFGILRPVQADEIVSWFVAHEIFKTSPVRGQNKKIPIGNFKSPKKRRNQKDK